MPFYGAAVKQINYNLWSSGSTFIIVRRNMDIKKRSYIEFHNGSSEELPPYYSLDFPYAAVLSELDKYPERTSPWHWHKEVELFYVREGIVEYFTPSRKWVFPANSGGLVNSNILHKVRMSEGTQTVNLVLHFFDPIFLAGTKGSLIDQKYISPIVKDHQTELLPLYPLDVQQTKILEDLRDSFLLSEQTPGYEIRLRERLSDIWLQIFSSFSPSDVRKENNKTGSRLKTMLVYVYDHYCEKITVADLARAALTSERECFRLFKDYLRTTPVEYIRSYRLQMSCQMLINTNKSITDIGQACGVGNSSYFGKIFREQIGCTPIQYRMKWQDSDI